MAALTLAAYNAPCSPGDRLMSDALSDNVFQHRIMRAGSMKGFVAGDESGHDHYFATFDKVGGALGGQRRGLHRRLRHAARAPARRRPPQRAAACPRGPRRDPRPGSGHLRHKVPVALATDDEGVSRTDLTEQYELAVTRHKLGYRTLKRMAVDSLRHAFLPDGPKATLLRVQAEAFARYESRFPG